MRKTLAAIVLLAIFAIGLPLAADAQTRCRTAGRRSYSNRSYQRPRYYAPASSGYYNSPNQYYGNQGPSFYRRHRNLSNIGIATGAGALIGGVAGGKRGALIGAASGAGAGALYTYVLKAKQRRY